MIYYVYSDGAYSRERKTGAWSYLIYTDKTFIAWESNKCDYIKTPTYAEDIAVGLACYELMTKHNLTKRDKVIIHSDSLSTITMMQRILKNEDVHINNILVKDSIDNIRKLSEITRIDFSKVRSHKSTLNPNICVDRMAKIFLRS